MKLEDGGRVLRGQAVPYGESAVVPEGGSLVRERFDQQSLAELPENVPLRVGHDRQAPPVGKVVEVENRSYGLAVAARLAVANAELDSWRARWEEGLASGLSVGFTFDRKQQHEWHKPTRRGELPTVVRRGVRIRELSIVQEPAYEKARILHLAKRSAAEQRSHEESERIISEFERDKILRAHQQRRMTAG